MRTALTRALLLLGALAGAAAALLAATCAPTARGEIPPLVSHAVDPATPDVDAIAVDDPPARRATRPRIAALVLGLTCIGVSTIAVLVLVVSFVRAGPAPVSASARPPSRDRPGSGSPDRPTACDPPG